MEALVLIKEVGAYSERQYQRQDGTTEYFKCRGGASGSIAHGKTRMVRKGTKMRST